MNQSIESLAVVRSFLLQKVRAGILSSSTYPYHHYCTLAFFSHKGNLVLCWWSRFYTLFDLVFGTRSHIYTVSRTRLGSTHSLTHSLLTYGDMADTFHLFYVTHARPACNADAHLSRWPTDEGAFKVFLKLATCSIVRALQYYCTVALSRIRFE